MGPDDKLVCVPLSNPMWVDVRDVGDSSALRAEIEQFFEVYKALEGNRHRRPAPAVVPRRCRFSTRRWRGRTRPATTALRR